VVSPLSLPMGEIGRSMRFVGRSRGTPASIEDDEPRPHSTEPCAIP
jgi:hypothetical protein